MLYFIFFIARSNNYGFSFITVNLHGVVTDPLFDDANTVYQGGQENLIYSEGLKEQYTVAECHQHINTMTHGKTDFYLAKEENGQKKENRSQY